MELELRCLVGSLVRNRTPTAVTASAAIVCSKNVCWHIKEHYNYPPSAGVVIHDDDWKAGPGITFREHEGRGYWSGDRWTEFEYDRPDSAVTASAIARPAGDRTPRGHYRQ